MLGFAPWKLNWDGVAVPVLPELVEIADWRDSCVGLNGPCSWVSSMGLARSIWDSSLQMRNAWVDSQWPKVTFLPSFEQP